MLVLADRVDMLALANRTALTDDLARFRRSADQGHIKRSAKTWIRDKDRICHARAVIAYLREHSRLKTALQHMTAGRAHLSDAEHCAANTYVSCPGPLEQGHAFFRNRSPGPMLALRSKLAVTAVRLRAELPECRLFMYPAQLKFSDTNLDSVVPERRMSKNGRL